MRLTVHQEAIIIVGRPITSAANSIQVLDDEGFWWLCNRLGNVPINNRYNLAVYRDECVTILRRE